MSHFSVGLPRVKISFQKYYFHKTTNLNKRLDEDLLKFALSLNKFKAQAILISNFFFTAGALILKCIFKQRHKQIYCDFNLTKNKIG